MKHPALQGQGGYVLISSLVFLAALTVTSVVGVQDTILQHRMGTNLALETRAFEASEGGRAAAADVLDAHVFQRGWDDAVTVPAGLEVLDKDSDGAPDILYSDNEEAAGTLLQGGTLTTDARLRLDGDGNAGYTGENDMQADISVYKTRVVSASGAATAMVSGYEGLGKASSAGGTHIYFELRSRGDAGDGATAVTASDFRVVVRN